MTLSGAGLTTTAYLRDSRIVLRLMSNSPHHHSTIAGQSYRRPRPAPSLADAWMHAHRHIPAPHVHRHQHSYCYLHPFFPCGCSQTPTTTALQQATPSVPPASTQGSSPASTPATGGAALKTPPPAIPPATCIRHPYRAHIPPNAKPVRTGHHHTDARDSATVSSVLS